MSLAPAVVRDGFAFANGDLYVDTSGLNRHRRAAVAELKDHFNKPGSEKDYPAHWFEAQLLHYGLQPSKTKSVARMRLFDAVMNGKLEVPGRIKALEAELKKEWLKNEREAKKAAKASSSSSGSTTTAVAAGKKRKADASNVDLTVNVGGINITVSAKNASSTTKASAAKKVKTSATPKPKPAPKATVAKPKSSTTTAAAPPPSSAPSSSAAAPTFARKQTARRGGISQGLPRGFPSPSPSAAPVRSSAPRPSPSPAAARPQLRNYARRSQPFSLGGRLHAPGPAATNYHSDDDEGNDGFNGNGYNNDSEDDLPPPPPYREYDDYSSNSNSNNSNNSNSSNSYRSNDPYYDNNKKKYDDYSSNSNSGNSNNSYSSNSNSSNDPYYDNRKRKNNTTLTSSSPRQTAAPSSSPPEPLGLLNGSYGIDSDTVSSEWPSMSSDLSLVLTLGGRDLWGKFDLGIVSGVLRFDDGRPWESSRERKHYFRWRGEEVDGPPLIGGDNDNTGWVRFLGGGRIEGELLDFSAGPLDFDGERLPGQGTRSEVDLRTMIDLWDEYGDQDEHERLRRARWR